MSSSEKVGSPNPFKANYWTAKRWFTTLIVLLIAWAGLYALLHADEERKGYEYVSFSKNQIRQINRILTTETSILQNTDDQQLAANVTDSLYPLSESTPAPKKYQTEAATHAAYVPCDLDCRTEKVILYINSEYENGISEDQLNTIRKYISTFGPEQVGIFLADHKVKVRSYFWLTGPSVYIEIVFWVIFGVICSLLFSVGNVVRRTDKLGFDPNQIIYQVAKLFYAPFSAIIIVLAYSYFNNSTTLNIDASEGIVVFAFIAGLYSGRVMNFFDKAKQVLLPSGNNGVSDDVAVSDRPSPVATKKEVKRNATTKPKEYSPQVDKATVTDADILKEMDAADRRSSASSDEDDAKGIEEVDIDLKLDLSGLYDEEKSELQKLGFKKAIVTLHNVNGKDIIPAKKLGEDTSTFVAKGVRPGIYIARATLSQKLKDDNIINLFGEKTAYVTVDKPGLELYVKKYQSVE